MKKYLIVIFLLNIIYSTTAQTETRVVQTIKGKVINIATNESISYTNIGIEGTLHGTASDDQGNFELKIPEEMISKEIYFSALGYKNLKFAVDSLFSKSYNIIKLEPQSYNIEDVDISAQSKVLERILRMASENTPYNFIGGPYNLICDFRNKKIINSKTFNQKAKVLIFDKNGYITPSESDAFKTRKYSIEKDKEDYSFSTGITNFDEILELDWVRSGSSILNPSLLDKFSLSLVDEIQNKAGKSFWIISFKQNTPTPEGAQDFHATHFEGKITIAKDDYSVKQITGQATSKMHNRQGKMLAVGKNNKHYYKDVTYDFGITYSNLKPDTFWINKKYLYNGNITEDFSELIVQKVQITNPKIINTRDYFIE